MPKEPLPRYLHPDYNPMRDKMDRLREILIHNKVKTPSGNVRKQDFIDLFEQHIRPQIPALRKYYENIKPSEKGIIKVPASTTTHLSNDRKQVKPAVPPHKSATVTSSSSSSSTLQQGHVSQPLPSLSSLPASTLASSSVQPVPETGPLRQNGQQTSGTESTSFSRGSSADKSDFTNVSNEVTKEDHPTKDVERGRTQRASTDIKDTKSIDDSGRVKRRRRSSSTKKRAPSQNFSKENPFQSSKESERRRRSKSRDGVSSTSHPSLKSRSASKSRTSRARSKSGNGLRETRRDSSGRMEHDDIFGAAALPAFSNYIRRPKYPVSTFDDIDSDGPPFHNSPLVAKSRRILEATLAKPKPLNFGAMHYHQGQREVGFNRIQNEKQQSSWMPFRLLLSVAVLFFASWYRQTRFQIGFCTSDSSTPSSPNEYQNQFWGWMYPTCIPCPTHATCLDPNEPPLCPPEYILKPNPLSFDNFLPLTPVCVLNKAKEYQSLQVADVAEHILHRKAGIEECKFYVQPPRTLEFIARQRISIRDLKDEIYSMKDSSISLEEFEQYWDLALKELFRRSDSLVFEQWIDEEYLRSLKPSKSLVCAMRQGFLGWCLEYQLYILTIIIASLSGFFFRRHLHNKREESKIVQSLVETVLSKLTDQSHYYYIDPFSYPEPYLSQIHLRDALLIDVAQPARRNELWEKVSTIVDKDANVRVSLQEVRGEIHRVWEWIGASGILSNKPRSTATSSSPSNSFRPSNSISSLHVTAAIESSPIDELVSYPIIS
ncbi:inner nuclear membrane protein enriched at telomere/subtelomere region [Lobosporangium transversale]|uniref:Man1-Src1p-C-terminal domain-domain-containing protein n=1 Tax=Lobosporangium transversale TaxID=64571 RepID=A0A1Y2GHP0_9FUNG|nr:Man1-Src1p-C-terminal domain-domain-containing protein [Lobosporangium transversale]KAF9902162.1 inner nuclear membrane protein enriched at telomere/subtelomere region [Lobosporangium transversale]ORZ09386.1 Man1-Src1p-C-terminal domain-domain-containing protein [Lobosporangium transversale]|eukprot:XP_021878839.1 Man1-Src1p-C-terminal domain-domain-containing protein [Lobosporangium transversale]